MSTDTAQSTDETTVLYLLTEDDPDSRDAYIQRFTTIGDGEFDVLDVEPITLADVVAALGMDEWHALVLRAAERMGYSVGLRVGDNSDLGGAWRVEQVDP